MRFRILLLLLCLLSLGCRKTCDLKYYSKVSQIHFPKEYRVLDCKDNGEYMSAMLLKVKKYDIKDFSERNYFEKVPEKFVVNFWGLKLLDSLDSKFPSNSSLYFKRGRSKLNTWIFLLDTNNGKLFGEIQYPDWSGDAP